MNEYVPGTNTYFWRTGSSAAMEGDDQKSDLFTTNLIVCGFESISLKNSDPFKIEALRAASIDHNERSSGTNSVFRVDRSSIMNEFVIDNSESAGGCGFADFTVVDGEGLAWFMSDLVVNVAEDVDSKAVKIRARTMGGKLAELDAEITVRAATTDDNACYISVTPLDDQEVIVGKNDGENGKENFAYYLWDNE